jgi:hypothetical protein
MAVDSGYIDENLDDNEYVYIDPIEFPGYIPGDDGYGGTGDVGDGYKDPGTGDDGYGTGGGGGGTGSGGTGTPNAAITDAFNQLFKSNFTGKQLAGLFGVAGGGIAGLLGANKPSVVKGTMGYQGKIPQYTANRNMATAPPTSVDGKPYRPGQGGVNYGGDVTYTPKGAGTAKTDAPTAPDTEDNYWQKMKNAKPAEPITGDFKDYISELLKTSPNTTPPAGGDMPAMSFHGFPSLTMPFKSAQQAGKSGESASRIPGVPDYMVAADTPDVTSRGMTMEYTPADRARDEAMRSRSPTYDASEAERMQQITGAAQGGLMGLAKGRYLQGNTDGMADKLRTFIDGKQPAALSHGEFVIPADVVSHLGNGNSDAGAKKLYSMMDKIREARTGTKKQGKQINPDKFMPGGLAQLAQGGTVQRFQTGGVPSNTLGTEQTLASWTGDYVPNMLAKGEALANAPYQQYGGPLTAGASDLQNQAFAGASGNALAGYTPTQFTSGTFDTNAANKYMNPFLQASLNPQIDEARRQSQIDQQLNNASAIKSGSFGGGARDIMNRASQRDLGSKLSGIVGTGYKDAYNNAQTQFNAEQNRGLDTQRETEKSRQYGADYGRSSIKDLADLGATQRTITGEGIAADKKAFEEARDNPYKMLQFQQSLLNGLPISAQNYQTTGTSGLTDVAGGVATVDKLLGTLGLSPGQTGAVTK